MNNERENSGRDDEVLALLRRVREEAEDMRAMLTEQSERIERLEKSSSAPPASADAQPAALAVPQYSSLPSIPVIDEMFGETRAQTSKLDQIQEDARRWQDHQRRIQRHARRRAEAAAKEAVEREARFKRFVAVLTILTGVATELLRLIIHH